MNKVLVSHEKTFIEQLLTKCSSVPGYSKPQRYWGEQEKEDPASRELSEQMRTRWLRASLQQSGTSLSVQTERTVCETEKDKGFKED